MAFPQADLDLPVYIEPPIGMEVPGSEGNKNIYVLGLRKLLYGLKQASANWYDMLKKGLDIRGFKESVQILAYSLNKMEMALKLSREIYQL